MTSPLRRLGPSCVALLSVAACTSTGFVDEGPQQVILITIDTLRGDHVGATSGRTLTPALNRFAADAVRYDDAVTNSTVTRASHASMLSGLYPWRHGVRDNVTELAADVSTLASVLKEHGFETGGIISSIPLQTFDASFEFFDDAFDRTDINRPNLVYGSPERATRVAQEWLTANRAESFFLWVHYFPPHGPYTPPPEFRTVDRTSGERLPIARRNYQAGAVPAYQELAGITDPEIYRSRYGANVRYVDFHAGVLLSIVKNLEIYDRAMIVVTSDHGESLGEHNWYFTHGNLVYREQGHVPLLVKLPGNERSGSAVTDPVQAVDIAPTVLEVLGLVDTMPVDGESLLRTDPRRLRFTESTDGELRQAPNVLWGTDGVRVFTLDDGWGWIFAAVEHWNAECVGWHVCKVGSRFAALDPIAQGLERLYGSLDADVARGLALRMDHGSQYLSDHFLKQIRYWGIHPSFGFVEEPETNGVVERWNRTLKEQAIHGRIFQNLEAVRVAVADFVVRYNQTWRLEKLAYQTPIEAREEYELRQAA